MLLECVPRIFGNLFSEGWDRIRQTRNPLARLQKRFETVLPVLKEFCAIIQLSKEAIEDSDPKIKQLGEQTYLSIRSPLEADITKGIEQGTVKPVDPKITATYMIGVIENLYYLQTIDKNLQPSVIWDNAGINVTWNDNLRPAQDKTLENLTDSFERDGYEFLDLLIDFLHVNRSQFPDFQKSVEGLNLKSLFINDATEFNYYFNINESTSYFFSILDVIWKVQREEIFAALKSYHF